jgi:hypothetical protein
MACLRVFDQLGESAMSLKLAVVVALVLGTAGLAPAWADDENDGGQKVQHEGPRELRAQYEAERHRKPNDPEFNVAMARFQALQQTESAMRSRVLPDSFQHGETWQAIGPAPLLNGQTPTSPIIPSSVSGRISSLAIDATDNAVYAGAAQGGVWRTLNGGASWTPLTDRLGSLAIGSIAIDPAPHAPNQGKLYIGTGEGNYSADSYAGVGVYKSTDSGQTWQGPYGSTLFTSRSVNGLVVDRMDSNHLLAVTGSGVSGSGAVVAITLPPRGIFSSIDGGVTWTKQTTQAANDPASTLIQDPVVPTTWWAAMYNVGGTTGGVQKSIDNGVTWTQVFGTGGLPPLASATGRSWITGADPGGANPSVLYIGNAASNGRVYKSVDGGLNWAAVPAANSYCSGQCFYDMPLYAIPGNPDILYTGGAGNSTDPETVPSMFMRSLDGGSTFASKVRSPSTNTALHADVHAITSYPGNPNEIWVGNDGGVWKSNDQGDTWINLNTSLQITQFEGCDLHPTNPAIAYGGTQDNGTNGWSGGIGWPHLDFGDGGYALIDQANPDNLVHTYFNQSSYLTGVGYTTSGFAAQQGDYFGSFADTVGGNGIGFADRVLFYAPIHLDRGVSDTLYFGTNKLYRANTFFSYPDGQPNIFSVLGSGAGGQDLAAPSGAISAIETLANPAIGLNATTVFTGANNGRVYRSTDSGLTFSEVDTVPGPINLFVSEILIDPRNPSIVYQARSGFTGALPAHNVRKSIDGGVTWADASIGLPDVPVNALVIDPVLKDTLWAGTDVGAFLSTNNGASWIPYSDGLPNVAIFDMKSNAATGQILACTHGRGAYRIKLDVIFIDGFDGP